MGPTRDVYPRVGRRADDMEMDMDKLRNNIADTTDRGDVLGRGSSFMSSAGTVAHEVSSLHEVRLRRCTRGARACAVCECQCDPRGETARTRKTSSPCSLVGKGLEDRLGVNA